MAKMALFDQVNKSQLEISIEECLKVSSFKWNQIPFYLFLPAATIIILCHLPIIRTTKFGHGISYSKIRLLIPINALEDRRFTAMICIIFVSYADYLFTMIAEKGRISSPILRTVVKLLLMIIHGTVAFPLFAAVTQPHCLLRFLTIPYAWCFLIMCLIRYVEFFECRCYKEPLIFIQEFFIPLPSVISLMILSVYYPLQAMRICQKKYREPTRDLRIRYYVKSLFSGSTQKCMHPESFKGELENIVSTIKIKKISGVTFPPLMLGYLSFAATMVYCIFIYLMCKFIRYERYLDLQRNTIRLGEPIGRTFSYFTDIHLSRVAFEAEIILQRLKLIWLYFNEIAITLWKFSLVFAVIYAYISIYLVISNFQHNLIRVMSDRHHYFNRVALKKKPNSVVKDFVVYSGYQTAYIFMGVVVHTCFFVFLLGVIITIVVFLKYKIFFDRTKAFVYYLGCGASVSLLIKFIQLTIVTLFFCQDKGGTLAVENRHGMFIFIHFIFFYNVLLGIFSLLLRVLVSIIMGVMLVTRMDHPVLPSIFKQFDTPYEFYVNYIYIINMHNNPLLLGFLSCFPPPKSDIDCHDIIAYEKETIKLKQPEGPNSLYVFTGAIAQDNVDRKIRAKIRWKLAYLLIWNPSLRAMRKSVVAKLEDY